MPPPPPVPVPSEGASANPLMTPAVGMNVAAVCTGAMGVGGGAGVGTGSITVGVGSAAFISSARGGVGIEFPLEPPPPAGPANCANIRSYFSVMARGLTTPAGPIDSIDRMMNTPRPCSVSDAASARPVLRGTVWIINTQDSTRDGGRWPPTVAQRQWYSHDHGIRVSPRMKRTMSA